MQHWGHEGACEKLISALKKGVEMGICTVDIGGTAGTKEAAEYVLKQL